jgi:hypothetical protein
MVLPAAAQFQAEQAAQIPVVVVAHTVVAVVAALLL